MAIKYPTNYDNVVDLPADLKEMAESIEDELDSKVDKVPGKGLSTEDYTTAEKTKISGIEEEANKTVVDESLDETSENPLQNKAIYAELAEKQEQIDALVEENSTMKKQQLKGQASGSSIQLTDSAEGLEIENVVIKGTTSQNTYEGYNLLNPYLANQTLNGVTVTYNSESQEITLNGTCTADNVRFSFNSENIELPANTNLYGLIKYVSGSSEGYFGLRTFVENWTNNFIVESTTGINADTSLSKNFNSDKTFSNFDIRVNSDSVFNNLKIKVMFSKENVDYEPYCGGEKSPNINYTQNVQCVTGTNTVEEKNKNWIKMTNGTHSNNGISAIVKNGVATLNGTATATSMIYITLENPLTFKANVRYKLSANNNNIAGTDTNVCGVRFGGDMSTIAKFKNQNGTCTFYFEQDTSFNQICIRTNGGITYENFVIKPQLEIGTASTDFVEGEYQNTSLNLGDIEVYDGDKITVAYVQEAEKKKINGASIVRKWKKYIFDGTETPVYRDNNGTVYRFSVDNIIDAISDSQCYSNFLRWYSNGASIADFSQLTVEAIHIRGEGTRGVGIKLNVDREISTAAQLKQLFKDKYDAETPLYIVYQLAEPETTAITDTTLLNQLETLINMKTYKQITNIETTGSDLALVLEFQYSKDLQTVIDSINARLELVEN